MIKILFQCVSVCASECVVAYLSTDLQIILREFDRKQQFKLFAKNGCCCSAFLHLGAGLSVGLSGLAAGFAIGIVGDAGVRGTAQQPKLFVGEFIILLFKILRCYDLLPISAIHRRIVLRAPCVVESRISRFVSAS